MSMSCCVSSLPQAASKLSATYLPSRSTLYMGRLRSVAEAPTTAGGVHHREYERHGQYECRPADKRAMGARERPDTPLPGP